VKKGKLKACSALFHELGILPSSKDLENEEVLESFLVILAYSSGAQGF
jgi:hypothetical protein